MNTPIRSNATNEYSDNRLIGTQISSTNSIPREIDLDSLTDEQLAILDNRLRLRQLDEKYEKQDKIKSFNNEELESLITDWLRTLNSIHTQSSFKYNLNQFIQWLKDKSILEVDSRIVDSYVAHLNSQSLSANTVRQRVIACSSFWTTLDRWKVIDIKNPFIGARGVPEKPISTKKPKDIPTDGILDLLEQYALDQTKATGKGSTMKIRAAIKAYCAIRTLRSTGLRVGALKNMIIEEYEGDIYYTAETKNGIAEGELDKELLDLYKFFNLPLPTPFEIFNDKTFRSWLTKAMNSEQWVKNVGNKYTPHSIRHLFSLKDYEEHKDIYRLSRKLGHKNTESTCVYLSTLPTKRDKGVNKPRPIQSNSHIKNEPGGNFSLFFHGYFNDGEY